MKFTFTEWQILLGIVLFLLGMVVSPFVMGFYADYLDWKRENKCQHKFIKHDRCLICDSCGKKIKIKV